jgi:cytoskeletal protein CcmA (bactofilin family)
MGSEKTGKAERTHTESRKSISKNLIFDGNVEFTKPCKIKGFVQADGFIKGVTIEAEGFIRANSFIETTKHLRSASYIKGEVVKAGGYIKAMSIIADGTVSAGWSITAGKIYAGSIKVDKAIIADEIHSKGDVVSSTSSIKAKTINALGTVNAKKEVSADDIFAGAIIAKRIKCKNIRSSKIVER